MISIQEEFEKLIQEAADKIAAKKENGEFSDWEAQELLERLEYRTGVLTTHDFSNYGKQCPEGHDDPDCGWSPSMGYHCS